MDFCGLNFMDAFWLHFTQKLAIIGDFVLDHIVVKDLHFYFKDHADGPLYQYQLSLAP